MQVDEATLFRFLSTVEVGLLTVLLAVFSAVTLRLAYDPTYSNAVSVVLLLLGGGMAVAAIGGAGVVLSAVGADY